MSELTRYQLQQLASKVGKMLERIDHEITPTYDEWNEMVSQLNLKSGRNYAKKLGLNPNVGLVDMIRSSFNEKIIVLIEQSGLTHQDIATTIKGSRSKISRVMNRKLKGITTDFLIRILSSLGAEIRINFSDVPD